MIDPTKLKDETYYTIKEITKILELPKSSWRKWYAQGLRPDGEIGKKKLFKGETFKNFMENTWLTKKTQSSSMED
jgi:hypothetical protein